MKRITIVSAIALCAAIAVLATYAAKEKKDGGLWTEPEKAIVESPGFGAQGEYSGDKVGIQVVALDAEGTKFYTSKWKGGLPGAGWDGSAPETGESDAAKVKELVTGLTKQNRRSPSLGKAPPEGATVLFDGSESEHIEGKVAENLLWAGSKTTGKFGDFKLHLEFRLPFKPATPPSNQDRGNSGIYIHNRYEVQVLDSFGLPLDKDQLGIKALSDPKQWCGCLYKFKTADVNMCLPPLSWQTYDIEFTAARFDDSGKKTTNARLTVLHNGVKIHDDVELPKGTGAGGGKPEVAEGQIYLQGHGNPVAFRNIWILPK